MIGKPYISPSINLISGLGVMSVVAHAYGSAGIVNPATQSASFDRTYDPSVTSFISQRSNLLNDISRHRALLRNPLLMRTTDDPLVAFEEHFRTFSRTQQEMIYAVAFDMARAFCRDVLTPRDNLIHGEDDLFGFPFAAVPLTEFDRMNSYWAVMDNVLGKSEGPRFVIDAESDVFVFGIAKSYSFKSVPVIHFTKVLESRMRSDSEISKVDGFVLNGKEQIFLLDTELEEKLIKMRRSKLARTLWEYAASPLAGASLATPSFDATVNEFTIFRLLAHEYGHILSFRDQRIAEHLMNPTFMREGRSYLHPSFERFHGLGEVYAELFGVMDALIESRSDQFVALFLACYAKDLTSSRRHGRTNAYAVISILMRNVHVDHENRKVRVDYDGLRRDIAEEKIFLYQQFTMYQNVTEQEIESWINGKMRDFLILNGLSKALSIESSLDASTKPQVESVLRDQAMKSFSLSAMVPSNIVLNFVETLRRESEWSALSNDGAELEERIAAGLPRLAQELQAKYEGAVLSKYVWNALWIVETQPLIDGIATTSLLPFVRDVNELMRIKSKIQNCLISIRYMNKGIEKYKFGDSFRDGTLITSEDIWHALRESGYIDDDGIIQPKYDGVLENFVLPRRLNRERERVFEELRQHIEMLERFKLNLLSLHELQELAECVMAIQKKYPTDKKIADLSAKILASISEAKQA